MKRRQFVKLPLAASALACEAFQGTHYPSTKEVSVDAGAGREGQPFEFLDATFK